MLLKDLNADARLELASRLLNSLKRGTPEPNSEKLESKSSILDRLYGAWDSEKETAEEMIARIQQARLSNREIEPFD